MNRSKFAGDRRSVVRRVLRVESLEQRQMMSITPIDTGSLGDANRDGLVDGVDYTVWADHFMTEAAGPSQGDFTKDGFVDGADYTVWADNFGRSFDVAAPNVAADLLHDTGPSGTDRITNQLAIQGLVSDAGPIQDLRIGLDDQVDAAFASMLDDLNADHHFSLTRDRLEELLGPISDGIHSFKIRATNGAGNVGETALTLTMDTLVPSQPVFDLSPTSDTGALGDGQTTASAVTLVGTAEPGAQLTLSGTDLKTVASVTGSFEFSNVPLKSGNNELTVVATDLAGNTSQSVRTIVNTNSAPVIQQLGKWVVSDQSGPLQIPLSATDADNDPIQFGFEILGDTTNSRADVTIEGNLLTITPRAGQQGAIQIRVFARDASAEDSSTFTVDVNLAERNGYSIENEILSQWIKLGGEGGIGLPTAAAVVDAGGKVRQTFEGGAVSWSAADGYQITDSNAKNFLQAPVPANSNAHTRAPTLLVITQGAEVSGHYTYPWETNLAANLRDDLQLAGSQVHTMIVQWDSFKPNDVGVDFVSNVVEQWLSERQQDWDVVLVGHSRGAIFNHEVAQELAGNSRIRTFQEIMLDPTADLTHGDEYPNSIAGGVDNAVVYNDGYTFIPTAVKDGLPVNGATYRMTSVPGMGYHDPGTHTALANLYARDLYKTDLSWLLSQNPVHTKSLYVHEAIQGVLDQNGNQLVVAPGPDGVSGYFDAGFDQNENGDFHGWITVTPIGGVDVTIGKSGLNASGGVVFLGSGAISMSDNGWMVNVNVFNAAGGSVIIGKDETRIDINVAGVNINMFGKDAGIFVGGKKLSFDRNAGMASGTFVLETTQEFGVFVRDTFAEGGQIAKEEWENGKQLVHGWLDSSGKWISQQYDGLGNVLSQAINFGGIGSQIYQLQNWTTAGVMTGFQEFTTAGAKIWDQFLDSSGKWVAQQLDGLGHVLNQWNYFGVYGSQLYQWQSRTVAGVLTGLEEFTTAGAKIWDQFLDSSGKWVTQQLDGLGHVLNQWNYFGGYGSQIYQWQSRTVAGVLTGFEEFTTAGAKIWDQFLDTSGKWVTQQLDGLGHVLAQWNYFGGYGSQLYQWQSRTAAGVLTGFEEFTTAGAKIWDQFFDSSGKWVAQQLDSLGHVLAQWNYFGGYGSQLYQWQSRTTAGVLTGFQEFTTAGGKIWDQFTNSSGKWISQQLDGLGHVLSEWGYFGGYGSQLYEWRSWTASGTFAGYKEFTTAGKKIWDQWLNSSGNWISQELDGFGHVLNQWYYYSGYGSRVYEWAAWNTSNVLTNLNRYTNTTEHLLTLQSYISTTGNWVERKFNNGTEYAVKVWNAAGRYLGDQYKNWSDAASNLDPTTTSWWPF